MRKVYINVEECRPGMQMAENIYNEYGAVIVSENTLLDLHTIRKLRNLDITKFRIYDQADNIISANSVEIFKVQYNENIDTVKDLLHDISSGKNVDTEKVNDLTDSITAKVNENRDIISCLNQIRTADEYTYTHCVNVSLLSMLISKWLKLDNQAVKDAVQAGLVHDIGKAKVPGDILNKPGKLSDEEFEVIKKHSLYGYRILENTPGISMAVRNAVLTHHERNDGSGYPVGLKGNQIPILGKILAVADIYDAMTSKRTYREKESPFEVFELMENKTFGVLDPTVVSAFLNNIASYYIGDFVRLNNGDLGEIIYINPRHISQPIIKSGEDFLDLTLRQEIKILELI